MLVAIASAVIAVLVEMQWIGFLVVVPLCVAGWWIVRLRRRVALLEARLVHFERSARGVFEEALARDLPPHSIEWATEGFGSAAQALTGLRLDDAAARKIERVALGAADLSTIDVPRDLTEARNALVAATSTFWETLQPHIETHAAGGYRLVDVSRLPDGDVRVERRRELLNRLPQLGRDLALARERLVRAMAMLRADG